MQDREIFRLNNETDCATVPGDMDFLLTLLVKLVLGMAIGFCIGLTGVGGGVLGLQTMTLIIGLDPIRAVGTTSLYIFLTNFSAVFHHARQHNVDWQIVRRMLYGAVPGVVAISLWISGRGHDSAFKQHLLRFIIGVVLFSVAVMVANLVAHWRGRRPRRASLIAWTGGGVLTQTILGVCCGGVIGGLIGATSIGGGVLIVPILVLVFGLSASRTVGTSIAITFFLTFVMAVIFGRNGELDTATAVIMAVGSIGGVRFGSRLSVRIPERILLVVMVALIAIAAVLMLVTQGRGAGG
jgi:uncharacterized membrane protein YfcA